MNDSPARSIDWDDTKQRVAQLGEMLQRTEMYSSEETADILRQRAQRLAEVVEQPSGTSDQVEVMIVLLAEERYAIETAVIREVLRLAPLTLLPGTASHIAGVVNLRGRPLLIIDTRELLGLACGELKESARVVVVGGDQAEFGLLAELTEEVTKIEPSEITEPPKSLPAAARRFVRGVTNEALIVLDSGTLLNDPRLWIDERED